MSIRKNTVTLQDSFLYLGSYQDVVYVFYDIDENILQISIDASTMNPLD
jgi:hypothetical protein